MTKIDPQLASLLKKHPQAQEQWESLTPVSKRDFTTWIQSAKQETTRARRVEKALDMLAKGKRRPCCYAVVPMDLYGELGKDAKAKATWKNLSPDKKRDFADWVQSAASQSVRDARVAKAKKQLATGKSNVPK